MLRVLKYATGHTLPTGAIYLTSMLEPIKVADHIAGVLLIGDTHQLWHYFLVDVSDDEAASTMDPPPPRGGR